MTNPKRFLHTCHQILVSSRDHLDPQSEDLWDIAIRLARSFAPPGTVAAGAWPSAPAGAATPAGAVPAGWSEPFGRVQVLLVPDKVPFARITTCNQDLDPANVHHLVASLTRATEWCDALNKAMTEFDLRSESIAFCKATANMSVAENHDLGDRRSLPHSRNLGSSSLSDGCHDCGTQQSLIFDTR